ncbi:hypothetical protein ACFL6U_28590 [Planctomycetota bacterium]
MYTGYSISNNRIWSPDGKTSFFFNSKHIYCFPKEYSGYYLTDGNCEGVEHVYGPQGYTKFYVQNNHIYGPDTLPPWENTSLEMDADAQPNQMSHGIR